ncbi:hypothetical protein HPB51_015007 [Rhipicephalus microplus]|uniref:Uncharacterized protein n=1 Tax=Rhipicephalus microplus TaxID=6941 RepID=A0A9J6EHQ8_RHIMP|nr:hypothetical protein HPB51_015007 [Rhipicephalus microplus]
MIPNMTWLHSLQWLLLVTAITALQWPGAQAQVGLVSADMEVSMMNSTLATTRSTTSSTTTTTKPDRAEQVFNDILERMTRFATREFYPLASELIYDPRLSPGCIGSLMKIGTALRTLDIWAVESELHIIMLLQTLDQ